MHEKILANKVIFTLKPDEVDAILKNYPWSSVANHRATDNKDTVIEYSTAANGGQTLIDMLHEQAEKSGVTIEKV